MRGRAIRVHMAHMPGHGALAQMPDGSYLFTSGIDGTLRPHDIREDGTSSESKSESVWWRSSPAKEPDLPDSPASDQHEKPVTSLAISADGNTLASASADGFVRLFQITAGEGPPSLTFMQSCARFAAAARALAFSPSGVFLAAAGEEPGVVKVLMTAQPTTVNILRAPTKSAGDDAIIAAAYDPRGDFVLSVGERGAVAVWNVDKCSFVRGVELNGRRARCVTWSPDGQAALIGTDRGAVVVPRGSWVMDFLLEDVTDAADDEDDDADGIFSLGASRSDIAAVAWSSNGRYALTAGKDSSVSAWDIHERKVLGVWKAEQCVQSLAWHNKTNAFVILDTNGQWGIVPDVVPDHLPPPRSDVPLIALPSLPDDDRSKRNGRGGHYDDDGDDENKVQRSSGARSKKEKLKERMKKAKERALSKKSKSRNNAEETIQEEGDDENDQQLENGFKVSLSDVDADDEDDVGRGNESESLGSQDSEEDSEYDEDIPGLADLENGGVVLPELKKHRKARSSRQERQPGCMTPVIPESFMPSSTPLSEKSSKKARILVWNLVGAVLSFDESTHDVIEVEFAEATRRTLGIKDHFGYSLGCLSETGVFLGSLKCKEHGAVVSFRPFNSWAQNSDWTQFMPDDENILLIALGQRFAAVITTPNYMVRLFSLSGLQTSVYAVSGNVVAATANGDMFGIVYCEAETGAMKVEVLEISTIGEAEKVIYNGSAKLSAGSKLEWLGFTNDTHELCLYDSCGWLWMLTDANETQRWMPLVQNAAKSASCDWYWAISVTTSQLIGVSCLSNERYPPARPRPGPRSVPLSAPVIERITKGGKPTVVERLLRTKLQLRRALAARKAAEEECDFDDEGLILAEEEVARIELEADKCLLSMMQDACQYEYNMRALDLATRLHCKVSFKYAVELAKHFKRVALVSRVEHVAAKKQEVLDEEARLRIQKTVTHPPGVSSMLSSQNAVAATSSGKIPGNSSTGLINSNREISLPQPTGKLDPMSFSDDGMEVVKVGSTRTCHDVQVVHVTNDEDGDTPREKLRPSGKPRTDKVAGKRKLESQKNGAAGDQKVNHISTTESRGNANEQDKASGSKKSRTHASEQNISTVATSLKQKSCQTFTNRFLKKS